MRGIRYADLDLTEDVFVLVLQYWMRLMNECRTGLVMFKHLWLTRKVPTHINLIRGQWVFREEQSVTHALSRLSPWTPVSMATTLGVYHEDKAETWP